MIVVLIGYMASGKSTAGKLLAKIMGYDFQDLDDFIEEKEGKSITDIFALKGEIYFRKLESEYLSELLLEKDGLVLSLGGGTPCYGNNMATLLSHKKVKTVYLRASLKALVGRLIHEKEKRPLISHLITEAELTEFIAKHLFERRTFYEQAEITVSTDAKTVDTIIEDLLENLNQ
ncbi:shikimate kinase [Gaetbulibacter sp. M240]|uniref:shikimate kinase n=1 Tax=Gaetbulibacter sp. M240 TaxID=3126511 RepID=UPI00374F42D3